jgi:DNA-binding transcriptional MerR regulator
MNERWTIEQLAPLVERALDLSGYDGQHSGRVRGLPNLRTIRYYTTLGLLDPPAEMRGRKAYYGRRHLVQLVAVKRLQSRGLSLAQVQQALAGIDDLALAELASLPADFWDRAATQWDQDIEAHPAPTGQRSSFWAAEPKVAPHQNVQNVESDGEPAADSEELPVPRLALHLPVLDGVQLVLEGIDPARWTTEAIARLKGPLQALAQTLRDLQPR